MRRGFYSLVAGGLLFAGVAFAVFEIVRPHALRPFVLFNALIMVAAGGAWLLDEFVMLTRRGR